MAVTTFLLLMTCVGVKTVQPDFLHQSRGRSLNLRLFPSAPDPAKPDISGAPSRREADQNAKMGIQEQFFSSIGAATGALNMEQQPIVLHTVFKVSKGVGLSV